MGGFGFLAFDGVPEDGGLSADPRAGRGGWAEEPSPLDRVRDAAFESIGRPVALAALVMGILVLSLAREPAVALQAGGGVSLAILAALMFAARRAATADPFATATWRLVRPEHRPPPETAAWAVATALREASLVFARAAAAVAILFWAAAAALAMAG